MYYSIHDFMVEDLELKGTDLNVFAFIYSFKEYKGSLETLSKFVGVKSITTIQYSLKRLIEQGYILKDKPTNKFATCSYKVHEKYLNNFNIRRTNANEREWNNCEVLEVIGGRL